MSYKEYTPPPKLQLFLDSYWISTNYEEKESRILPDGFVDIIFDLNSETCINWENKIKVSGMMTKYRNVISKKNSEAIGVRFKTGQFNAISNIPLSEIKNKVISASDIFPQYNSLILEKLIESKTQLEKIQFLNDLLVAQIKSTDVNSLELSVCKSISSNYQAVDIFKIAKDHCVSLRQLERRFKAKIGVTMKEYHSIVRFTKTIEHISANPNSSLLNIAFDNGYFDHSHLTKEINRMSGINPSKL